MSFVEGKLYEIVPPPTKGYKFNHAYKPMLVVCTTNVFMFLNELKNINNKDYVFYDVSTKDSISIDSKWAEFHMREIK